MRVIVVGAGPVGLTLAHMLPLAGITDFVVLERRAAILEESGAGVGLWPHCIRILDQLGNGVLEGARQLSPRVRRSKRCSGSKGELVLANDLFEQIEENHGHPFMLFERARLLQLLYEQLPPSSSACILPGKSIVSLLQSESGVKVGCADGSSYEGDIVIGADGVRSAVRSLMFQLASSSSETATLPSEPQSSMPKGLSTTFKCIFGLSPQPEGLSAGEMIDTQDGPIAWQLLTSDELVVWFVYINTKRTVTHWQHYTDDEMTALAEQYLTHPVSDTGVTFGDLWRTRKRSKLVDLEEGVLEKWHQGGRVVLVGDSAHKMTSNLALGANNGIESAASLVNQLYDLLQRQKDGGKPGTTELDEAFVAYQKERYDRAASSIRFCGSMIRYAGWLNGLLRFACRFMTIDSGDRFVADVVFPWLPRDGVVLNFVEEKNHKTGKIPWAKLPKIVE